LGELLEVTTNNYELNIYKLIIVELMKYLSDYVCIY